MPAVSELPADFLLNNGLRIPSVGLGTFQGDTGNDLVKEIVLAALKKGYRHIDTASGYGNEKEIGYALLESGIAREHIFVTTKL
jgi:alcohol dehydrogenase (NADP+)